MKKAKNTSERSNVEKKQRDGEKERGKWKC